MRAASEIRFGDENRTQSLVHKRGDDGTRKKNDDPEKKRFSQNSELLLIPKSQNVKE